MFTRHSVRLIALHDCVGRQTVRALISALIFVILAAMPMSASAAILKDGMINCITMSKWQLLLGTDTKETPQVLDAIRKRNWGLVREDFLDFDKIPDGLDSHVRRRVRREMASAELFYASARGDLRRMGRLLKAGADPNAASIGDTLDVLDWAAVCDHPRAVSLLIRHGAHVEQHIGYADDGGMTERTTALIEASDVGARRAVAVLLAHHADVNAVNVSCAHWDVTQDLRCNRSHLIITNALAEASDPVIRRMLRAAGARRVVHRDSSSTPVELLHPSQ